jgi:transaldolase
MKPAIFLDRDGVMNHCVHRGGVPASPRTTTDFHLIDSAVMAVRSLSEAGFLCIVITNQPDLGSGRISERDLHWMHAKLKEAAPVDAIYVCGHRSIDMCECRKPKPGMIVEAQRHHGVDLSRSWLVGDRWVDIAAGNAAGVRSILIEHEFSMNPTSSGYPPEHLEIHARVADLAAAEVLIGELDREAHTRMVNVPNFERRSASRREYTNWEKSRMEHVLSRESLSVRIFADGADIETIASLAADKEIKGFTTNPTLMRQAGVEDYESFARQAIEIIGDRPISLEVFSDDFSEMDRQARKLAGWAPNVYVKIPVTNTKAESSAELVRNLTQDGIQLNVTALLTMTQVREIHQALVGGAPSCISVFAGRIADAGTDPLPIMRQAVEEISSEKQIDLIWASPREVFNVVQAHEIGCHIITVTPDILRKLPNLGKDLTQFSLETVMMFAGDAESAGYQL